MAENSIDLSYLKTISMGKKDFELKLLKIFVEQTTVEMEKIQQSFERNDWNSLSTAAHKIKPSFHFIGSLDAELLLNTIEGIARNKNNLEKLPELVNAFLQSCKEITKKVQIEIENYKRLN